MFIKCHKIRAPPKQSVSDLGFNLLTRLKFYLQESPKKKKREKRYFDSEEAVKERKEYVIDAAQFERAKQKQKWRERKYGKKDVKKTRSGEKLSGFRKYGKKDMKQTKSRNEMGELKKVHVYPFKGERNISCKYIWE